MWTAFCCAELIKVYDGIASFRHHSYKLISVPRHTSVEQLVAAAMWAFHLTGDPGTPTFFLIRIKRENFLNLFLDCFFSSHIGDYYLTDLCGNSEKEIDEPYPIPSLTRVDGRKPALLLRFR